MFKIPFEGHIQLKSSVPVGRGLGSWETLYGIPFEFWAMWFYTNSKHKEEHAKQSAIPNLLKSMHVREASPTLQKCLGQRVPCWNRCALAHTALGRLQTAPQCHARGWTLIPTPPPHLFLSSLLVSPEWVCSQAHIVGFSDCFRGKSYLNMCIYMQKGKNRF